MLQQFSSGKSVAEILRQYFSTIPIYCIQLFVLILVLTTQSHSWQIFIRSEELPSSMESALSAVIKVVNFVRSRPLHHRIIVRLIPGCVLARMTELFNDILNSFLMKAAHSQFPFQVKIFCWNFPTLVIFQQFLANLTHHFKGKMWKCCAQKRNWLHLWINYNSGANFATLDAFLEDCEVCSWRKWCYKRRL